MWALVRRGDSRLFFVSDNRAEASWVVEASWMWTSGCREASSHRSTPALDNGPPAIMLGSPSCLEATEHPYQHHKLHPRFLRLLFSPLCKVFSCGQIPAPCARPPPRCQSTQGPSSVSSSICIDDELGCAEARPGRHPHPRPPRLPPGHTPVLVVSTEAHVCDPPLPPLRLLRSLEVVIKSLPGGQGLVDSAMALCIHKLISPNVPSASL